MRRPILVETDEGAFIGNYFSVYAESETASDKSNWSEVIWGDPTSGDMLQHRLYAGQSLAGPRHREVMWGQSIESECPWIQNFNREFGAKSSVKSLKRMFAEVSRLVDNGNFEQVDRILRLADPHRYNLDFVTGLLRATFMHRSSLPSWKSWLRETEKYLADVGEDAEAELAGLKQS